MAAHEQYIADYYAHLDNEKAVEIRLLGLAAQYGETPAGANALLELTRRYSAEHNDEYATLAYRALKKLHPEGVQTEQAAAEIQLAQVDVPPTADPLDLLLIANGRKRPSERLNVPAVPLPPKPVPSSMPTIDPFGRSKY
jgi:hypothetical protein